MSQAPERLQNYELIRKLASGGMAEVFLAKQKSVGGFERLVCVKCILPHLSEQHDFITMFHDEARIVANFNHPNIAQIIEIGIDDGRAFIAMEYVEGEDLRNLYNLQAKLGEPIPQVHAAHITQCVAAGLHYAHERTDLDGNPLGVVHRDISPQNILISHDGHVKVIDFGVAKAANKMNETRVGVLKGKYAYMSPEQAMGDPIDGRTDVFALAITLYEITTGTRLFKRKNELETLHAVIECEITPPSHIISNYDPELEKILLKALSHEPDHRYRTAGDFEAALQNYLVAQGYHTRPNTLANYLTSLKSSAKSNEPQEQSAATDVPVDGLTGNTEPTAVTQFAAAAARLLQEPTDSPPPMSFDSASLDSGTVKLSKEETAQSKPNEPIDRDATVVVERALFQTTAIKEPETTVVKQVHPSGSRKAQFQKKKQSVLVALGSILLGLIFASSIIYIKQKQENAPQVMSGPVIIESKPTGAFVVFSGRSATDWNTKYGEELTPLIIEEGLPCDGNWSITLKKSGFENVEISLPRFDPAPTPATITIPLSIEYNKTNQGTVTFISDPAGAHILVDGTDLNTTTPLQAHPTEAGTKHEVEMTLPGFLPHYETFQVEKDSHLSIRVVLEPESAQLSNNTASQTQSQQEHMTHGYLTVRSPIQSRVFIDGKLSGVTPLNRKVLKVGAHEVEILNDQTGLSLSRTLHVRPGSTSLLKISKKKGFLSVNAKPWAKVKVGKTAPEDTPHRMALFEGNYTVQFECPDGHTIKRPVSIRPGQTSPVVVNCNTE